jgi:hypothetical protein
MNRIFLLFATLISTFCNAQHDVATISMADVAIPGVLIIGSYSQLIESEGKPSSRFNSTINPVNKRCIKECRYVPPAKAVQCEHLVYEAFEYVRIGDSVQLIFIDLTKTKLPIHIKDLVIDRTISQKNFLYEIKKRGWWTDDENDYKIGRIESHYGTYNNVNNYMLNFEEDPYSSVIFTFHDKPFNKKIWWIEFPIMKINMNRTFHNSSFVAYFECTYFVLHVFRLLLFLHLFFHYTSYNMQLQFPFYRIQHDNVLTLSFVCFVSFRHKVQSCLLNFLIRELSFLLSAGVITDLYLLEMSIISSAMFPAFFNLFLFIIMSDDSCFSSFVVLYLVNCLIQSNND